MKQWKAAERWTVVMGTLIARVAVVVKIPLPLWVVLVLLFDLD